MAEWLNKESVNRSAMIKSSLGGELAYRLIALITAVLCVSLFLHGSLYLCGLSQSMLAFMKFTGFF